MRRLSLPRAAAAELESSSRTERPFGASFLVVFPFLVAIAIGILTAVTGHCILVASDYLSDIRFGYCHGRLLASRRRCCQSWSDDLMGLDRGKRCSSKHSLTANATNGSTTGEEEPELEWIPWPQFLGLAFLGYTATLQLSFVIYVAFSALMAGVAAMIVCVFCQDAGGGGIAEVKAAVAGYDLPKSLSGRCLITKTLGLALAMGAGLELLADDPLVHVSACWAQVVQSLVAGTLQLLRLPRAAVMAVLPLHEIACIGVATGVATAFGTPLGGVLFALEELGSGRPLGHRALLLAFTSAFVASALRNYLNPYTRRSETCRWKRPSSLFDGR
eukprot:TRINITY_DN12273_c0_g1_i6.p1 TRINITY_DN12273_c0_g1~~TRINITY_DN12273_c0_g1_i6.p1  ORF type:complete len:331 (-),score=44.27 TRINITY_DN12273_c0_g1_i6:148-1140(-)